ncbi:hypothetical protein, partial [Nitratifractor sp.]
HYSSWHLTIPYLKIREEFQEAPPGKLCFLMIDPMEALLRMLDRWYRLGGQKRAFPFFETFKEKVDALDRSSTDFARELAEWLIEQNPRPLYNPQIATLDASRRLYMAKKLLKKDFDYKRIVSVEENRSQSDRSPIMKIDRQRDREHVAAFFEEDAALFEAIESGMLDKRPKRADKKTRAPQKAEKRKKGLITRITPHRIEGWILSDNASEESEYLILRVNGKRVIRQELPLRSQKSQKGSGRLKKVKFSLKGFKLTPGDRIGVILNPGAHKLPFTPEAKGFFKIK